MAEKESTAVEVPEPALNIYYLGTGGANVIKETVKTSEITKAGMERVVKLRPLIVLSYTDKPGAVPDEIRALMGQKLVVCTATHYLLVERLRLDLDAARHMIRRFGGRFFLERSKEEDVYRTHKHLLDENEIRPMPAREYRKRVCEGIFKLAESMADENPLHLPDILDVRIARVLAKQNITSLRDLARLQVIGILRVPDLGINGQEHIFKTLMVSAREVARQRNSDN